MADDRRRHGDYYPDGGVERRPEGYDTHILNTGIHVTPEQKARWEGAIGIEVVDPAEATESGDAADALKVKQALAGKASTEDATLTPVFDPDPTKAKWICDPAQVEGYPAYSVAWTAVGPDASAWVLSGGDDSQVNPYTAGNPNAATVSFEISSHGITPGMPATVTATRVPVGYYLGSDQTKILTPKEVADALAAFVATKYTKPSGGIPKSDLASAVQTSLDKADAPIQPAARDGSSNITSFYAAYRDGESLGVGQFPSWYAHGLKADKTELPYIFNAATVSSGTTPTVTGLVTRAINYATLGSSVTAATVTLSGATSGVSRDLFIDLTIEASAAPTMTFVDPATNTTANVAFGAAQLADIDTGENLVMFSELPNNRWLVSVKHKEAVS